MDWDGTVADTISTWVQVFKELFSSRHISLTDKEIFENVYGTEEGSSRYGISDYKVFNQLAFDRIEEVFETIPLFPHAASVIKNLSDCGVKIAVVTSTPRNLIFRALQYHKIDAYISLVLGREDVKELKPSPEGIIKASHLLGSDVEQTIYIGDSNNDFLAGNTAGMKTLLFIPNHKFTKVVINRDTVKVDRVLDDWRQVPSILF